MYVIITRISYAGSNKLTFFLLKITAYLTVRPSCDFIWDFKKLPFPSHLGKYFNKIGKISAKIHEIGKKGHFWIGNDSHIRL